VRRDHVPPSIVGGRGRSNWVLHGLAAALILLGLVDKNQDPESRNGKALFKATVKRVERWIADAAAAGHFYVKPACPDRPASMRSGLPLNGRRPLGGQA